MSAGMPTPGGGVDAQIRLARALLLLFVAGLVLAWGLSPSRSVITERLLGNIALSQESGFDASFGAFPELVKDNGGAVPVPPEPTAPLRTPEYRGLAWLNSQPADGYTLQVAMMTHERAVGEFLFMRPDRDRFIYFKVPVMPDPAETGSEVVYRYAVCYGQFASREEALNVAAAIPNLPGQALTRSWKHYQEQHAALPEPVPVIVTPEASGADAATGPAPDVVPASPAAAEAVPGGVPVTSLPATAAEAGD